MNSITRGLSGNVDDEAVKTEIRRIRSMDIKHLRAEWTSEYRRQPPKVLTKDLLARMLCWRFQEKLYGGFDKATLKILESYAKGAPTERDRLLCLQPGTEIVRDYQGVRHVVTITKHGFCWREENFTSLSRVAKAITGTNWNGLRFFGLRPVDRAKASKTSQSVGMEEAV